MFKKKGLMGVKGDSTNMYVAVALAFPFKNDSKCYYCVLHAIYIELSTFFLETLYVKKNGMSDESSSE